MNKFSLFYFPSPVIFVDDDALFLQEVIKDSVGTKARSVCYTDVEKFFSDIKAKKYLLYDENPLIGHKVKLQSSLVKNQIEYDITQLIRIASNLDRFKYISVVVADYNMPYMHGLEFLSRIKSNFVKRVLLTGDADEGIAVEAFNGGLIDCFIRKDDIEMSEKLTASIQKLQNEFFSAASSEVLIGLKDEDGNLVPGALHLEKFESFFKRFLNDNKIEEYYLLDTVGSFYCVDSLNNVKILSVKSIDNMDADYLELTEEVKISVNLKEKIKDKTKMFVEYLAQRRGSKYRKDCIVDAFRIPNTDFYYGVASQI